MTTPVLGLLYPGIPNNTYSHTIIKAGHIRNALIGILSRAITKRPVRNYMVSLHAVLTADALHLGVTVDLTLLAVFVPIGDTYGFALG
ncbi:hypothetical protein D3C72_1454710 [compost metagenome]